MVQYLAANDMIAYYKDFCWAQFPQKLILPSVSAKSHIFFERQVAIPMLQVMGIYNGI